MPVLSRREFSLRCPPTDRGANVLPAAYHWSIAPSASLLDDGLGRYLSISSAAEARIGRALGDSSRARNLAQFARTGKAILVAIGFDGTTLQCLERVEFKLLLEGALHPTTQLRDWLRRKPGLSSSKRRRKRALAESSIAKIALPSEMRDKTIGAPSAYRSRMAIEPLPQRRRPRLMAIPVGRRLHVRFSSAD